MAAANSFSDIKTWKEKNEFLFKNKIMSDCKFIITESDGIQQRIIPAHKYVLGSNSSEFYNLFYLMKSSDEIPVEDTSADNFTKFLEFLYTENTTVTMENVDVLLKLAKTYSVRNFEAFCGEFLSKNVNMNRALKVMDKYSHYHMPSLMDTCASLLSDTHLSLDIDAFLKIRIETLTCLLKSEEFRGDEIRIFNLVNQWAETFCKEGNLEINSKNKRLALKPAFEYIRFGSMTCDEIALCTVDPSVLTPDEIIQILQFIATKGKVQCKFSAKKRPPLLSDMDCNYPRIYLYNSRYDF